MRVNEKIQSVWHESRFIFSSKKKAAYIGWNGYRNLGDEALLKACEFLLEDHFILYKKHYTGKGVQYLMNNRFDVSILGGGTLIHSDSFLERFSTLESDRKIVFGTGVMDPVFWKDCKGIVHNTEGWRNALDKADYLSVRGPRSKEILVNEGVTKTIEIAGDPALVFADPEVMKKPGGKVLGVNVGRTRDLLWGGNDESFLSDLIPHLQRLGKIGWKFKFFPVSRDDLGMIQKTMETLAVYGVECVKNFISLESYINEMRSVDIFLGEKLHSVILALCTCTPSVMLEYRPKCLDFMRSMEMEHMNFRTDEIKSVDLGHVIESAYADMEKVQKDIFEKLDYYKKTLSTQAETVTEICRAR